METRDLFYERDELKLLMLGVSIHAFNGFESAVLNSVSSLYVVTHTKLDRS